MKIAWGAGNGLDQSLLQLPRLSVRRTDLVSITPAVVATTNMSFTLLLLKKMDCTHLGLPFGELAVLTYEKTGSANGTSLPR